MRRQLIESFISALKEKIIPWHRNWEITETPRNAISEKEYRGLNVLWLQYVSQKKGYNDSRWCTLRQAEEKGWRIKKGEKGTRIEYYSLYDKKQNRNISFQEAELLREKIKPEEYQKRIHGFTKEVLVFNAEQMEGIPASEKKIAKFPAEKLLKQRDVILKNMGLKFEEGGDRVFYDYHGDKIRMPRMEQFKDAYGYMSTFLHEVGHATGHPKRLHRNMIAPEGSPGYAREELRAEIASAFMGQELNLAMTEEHMLNHKAYIQDWIHELENNPYELITAVLDAEMAVDYILENSEFRSLNAENVIVQDELQAVQNHRSDYKNEVLQENMADQSILQKTDEIKILGLYEWRGKNGCVHYRDAKGRHCLTDGMTVLEDVDFHIMNSIGGLTDTKGIDADAFAEKLHMFHPELPFSKSQLRWIDKKTEKHSIVPPEENGIDILNLFEVDGQERYVHFSFQGKERLTDGFTLYTDPQKIQSMLGREGMKRVASIKGKEIMGNLDKVQNWEIAKRLIDSLSMITHEGIIRMPDLCENKETKTRKLPRLFERRRIPRRYARSKTR